MDLKITQQFGQIGINYAQARMDIRTGQADMQLITAPPEMEIKIDYPRVHIDQTQALADIGYKKVIALEAEQAHEGQATVLSGIERVAREGDSLARSAGRGTALIADIAWQNSFDNRDYNVAAIPHTPPKIWFTGGININVRPGNVRLQVNPNFPEIKFAPGKVNIYLEQEPLLKIETTGTYLDLVI
ncbi:DUF6470 family protein [Thermincola potens]|uniref:Uncharacterized protein n=1 Tax=Thermincola potens (strain JR) TaxID=635013 RepID=D5XCV2_THEPJ|nr:DUF6470 family protein [Thermincola potens]ADG83628.1 conserved hypothetical protein [Thermincola potens JR]